MFHPYVLLGSLVFAIGLFASGVSIGYKWSERAHAAAVVTAQVEAIERANQDADIEKQRALSAAKTEADARLKASAKRHRGELDAARKAKPECARDADSVRLLLDAIADANGDNPRPTSELSHPLRSPANSSFWNRLRHPAMGVSTGGDSGAVPPPPR